MTKICLSLIISLVLKVCNTAHTGNECLGNGALYLTPLIERNNLIQGRNLAKVTELKWNIKSYSGLITVNKKFHSNMFFWYFPAENKPETVPLLIWLNGYATASSYGVFLQNGPYNLLRSSRPVKNRYSWQKYFHVIYIDNPLGVGYSSTCSEEGYSTNFQQLGENLHETLRQVMTLFPELSGRDHYITGLSLAGKYTMALADEINRKNVFNVKGIFVGNPLLNPQIQFNYGPYMYELGFIDKKIQRDLESREEELRNILENKNYKNFYEKAVSYIIKDDNYLQQVTGLSSVYDYNAPYVDPQFYMDFISRGEVKRALHVGNLKFENGTKAMEVAAEIFAKPVTDIMERLLTSMRILVYEGQMDVICAYPMLVDTLSSLNWTGQKGYLEADREQLLDRKYLWGYKRTYDNLSDVLVRKASHSAVTDQPGYVLSLLLQFTQYHRF